MAQKTNEQKAQKIATKYSEYYDGSKEAGSTSYNSAMEMAQWKDEEHNECKKDILTLVNLIIPCNEENESIINDLKNLLK
ncbi:MAG: hypothetical protein II937_13560 [Bacteroidales bacterium]|nr:hypothetical protein [Bacteroidales bacterium]